MLYKLNLNLKCYQVTTDNKRKCKRGTESSSMLWRKGLGHISNERIERLTRDEILQPLDYSDFGVCIDCIKGKKMRL